MKNSKTVTVSTKKVVRKKSDFLTLKGKVNENWKNETFSLSGLIRYAQNEGANDFKMYLSKTEEKNGVSISPNRILRAKTILQFATERETTLKNGSRKTRFSYWFLLNIVGRYAKAQKAAEAPQKKVLTRSANNALKKVA